MGRETVIYTAICGGYDTLKAPRRRPSSADLVCFTDDPELRSSDWDVRYVPRDGSSSTAWNRKLKMLPHLHFPEHHSSIYIDGNIAVVADPMPLLSGALSGHAIAIPPHPERKNLFEELDACVGYGKISADDAIRWRALYEQAGLPRSVALFENNLIVRAHNDPRIVALMTAWWEMFEQYGGRDQLSLALLAWLQKVEIAPLADGPRTSQKYFSIGAHEAQKRSEWSRGFASHVRANKDVNRAYGLAHGFFEGARRLKCRLWA